MTDDYALEFTCPCCGRTFHILELDDAAYTKWTLITEPGYCPECGETLRGGRMMRQPNRGQDMGEHNAFELTCHNCGDTFRIVRVADTDNMRKAVFCPKCGQMAADTVSMFLAGNGNDLLGLLFIVLQQIENVTSTGYVALEGQDDAGAHVLRDYFWSTGMEAMAHRKDIEKVLIFPAEDESS